MTDERSKIPSVDDPRLQRVLERLSRLPEYLEEKRRKRIERAEFVRQVFGSALEATGLLKPKEVNKDGETDGS